MIDIHDETLISLSKASQLLPYKPSPATLWRWFTRGVNGVRLETAKIGKRRYTSREALQRFVTATTEAERPEPEITPGSGTQERDGAKKRRLQQQRLLSVPECRQRSAEDELESPPL